MCQKIKHAHLLFFLFFSGAVGEGVKVSTETPQAHLSASTPSI
jgi:hypothetical protein